MTKINMFSKERISKIAIYVITDIIIINISLIVAISLWYDGTLSSNPPMAIPHLTWVWYKYMAFFTSIFGVFMYSLFRMYNNLWKYASIDELMKIFICTTIVFISSFYYDKIVLEQLNLFVMPKRLLFLSWMLNTILFMFSRFGYRALKRMFILIGHTMTSKAGCKQIMIVGAGYTGYGVIRGMLNSKIRDKYPAIVVDNDANKNNTNLLGVRVISDFERIKEIATKYKIDEIVIALPDAPKELLDKVIAQCTLTDCIIKIIPPIKDIDKNDLHENNFRDLQITDLLFRDEVVLDTAKISSYITQKVILVTGGGGSIGSELCRQICKFSPKQVIIFDIYENNAFYLKNYLKDKYKDSIDIKIRIGSICDIQILENTFKEFSPQVVFHAAAHKHVYLMEENHIEAIKNNVFGTLNVVKCSDKFNVERFVQLSTDKAVNPQNIMGATKRITELIVQTFSQKSKTKFMAVRFGNVLGSEGSVIHIFKKQIEAGGPVTVTHPDVERFFMTIPEASQLVLQAGAFGLSGSIFVLDMGEPVKIEELAKNIIKLSGLKPNIDIKIIYSGLLSGEKLKEELILSEEKLNLKTTHHKKIFIANPIPLDYTKFETKLNELEFIMINSPNDIEKFIYTILPNYKILI